MSILLVIPTVVESEGSAAGEGEAIGFSGLILSSVGEAEGLAEALGLTSAIYGAVGLSEGTSEALGYPQVIYGSMGTAEGSSEALGYGALVSQRTVFCSIQGIYDVICRDPETASGGLDPLNVELHAPGFYRTDREDLEFLVGPSIDRKVQVMVDGTNKWLPINVGTKRLHVLGVTIRIGYFTGDHALATFEAMADDDALILRTLSKQSNWPACRGLSNVKVLGSKPVKLEGNRQVLEIYLNLQVA